MKVIAFSDTHGVPPKITDEFDLMLIGGDVCPVWNHNRQYQFGWLVTEFAAWVNCLPFKDEYSKVILCAGNHDFIFESAKKSMLEEFLRSINNERLVYLNNEEYDFKCPDTNGEVKTYKIFATPYCKIFGRWAFMRDGEKLEKYYSLIPENVDFLLSHDAPAIPPYGIIRKGTYSGVDAGNKFLAEAIYNKKPKFALHGHIHSSSHELSEIENCGAKIACVAIMDEDYNPTYDPLIIDYEK